jgi:hypothetical protein
VIDHGNSQSSKIWIWRANLQSCLYISVYRESSTFLMRWDRCHGSRYLEIKERTFQCDNIDSIRPAMHSNGHVSNQELFKHHIFRNGWIVRAVQKRDGMKPTLVHIVWSIITCASLPRWALKFAFHEDLSLKYGPFGKLNGSNRFRACDLRHNYLSILYLKIR